MDPSHFMKVTCIIIPVQATTNVALTLCRRMEYDTYLIVFIYVKYWRYTNVYTRFKQVTFTDFASNIYRPTNH